MRDFVGEDFCSRCDASKVLFLVTVSIFESVFIEDGETD